MRFVGNIVLLPASIINWRFAALLRSTRHVRGKNFGDFQRLSGMHGNPINQSINQFIDILAARGWTAVE